MYVTRLLQAVTFRPPRFWSSTDALYRKKSHFWNFFFQEGSTKIFFSFRSFLWSFLKIFSETTAKTTGSLLPVNFVVVFENIFKNDHKNDHKVYRKPLPVVFVVVSKNIFKNDHKVYRNKKLQNGVHIRKSQIPSTFTARPGSARFLRCEYNPFLVYIYICIFPKMGDPKWNRRNFPAKFFKCHDRYVTLPEKSHFWIFFSRGVNKIFFPSGRFCGPFLYFFKKRAGLGAVVGCVCLRARTQHFSHFTHARTRLL